MLALQEVNNRPCCAQQRVNRIYRPTGRKLLDDSSVLMRVSHLGPAEAGSDGAVTEPRQSPHAARACVGLQQTAVLVTQQETLSVIVGKDSGVHSISYEDTF